MDLDSIRRAVTAMTPNDLDPQDHMLTDEELLDDTEYEEELPPEPVLRASESPVEASAEEEATNEPAISDDELASLIRREIDKAEQFRDLHEERRTKALDYYFGRQPAQTNTDRSGVVSKDVADVVEATLAQLMNAFPTDQLVRFPPVDETDEDQAEEEGRLVNWVFAEECGGANFMYEVFKDALIQAIGIGKAYWRAETKIAFDEYRDLMPVEVAQALQPKHPDEQVDIVGQEQGEQTVSIRVRRRWIEETPAVGSVSPFNFLFDDSHESLFMDDCRFVAERRILSASELLDMGFDKDQVDDLPSVTMDEEPFQATLEGYTTEREEMHRSTRPIEVYECYYLLDRDGDGYAERLKVFFSNDQLLEVEECDSVPYCVACPFPLPHQVIGEGMYDKLGQVQDIKTAMLRIAIDNAIVNTFGRYEVQEGMINPDDLNHPKPGGWVRSKRVGSIVPLAMADIGTAPMSLLQYMDKVRSEGAGPALDMQSENLPLNTQTAHGTERVVSAMEQLVNRIAESFSTTLLSQVFRKLHDLLMKHGKGEIQAPQPNGTFIVSDPRMWRDRDRVTVSVGKTQGDKLRAQAALQTILGQQVQFLQLGQDGTLVDWSKIHNTLVDIARNSDLQAPQQYWIDPASPEAQQSAQMKAQQAQQQAQQQQQQMQMLIDIQMQLQQMQEETKRLKAQMDYQVSLEDRLAEERQHREDLAVKLTDIEAKARAEQNRNYQQNLRTANG